MILYTDNPFCLIWFAQRGKKHVKFYSDAFQVFIDARKHKRFIVTKVTDQTLPHHVGIIELARQGV